MKISKTAIDIWITLNKIIQCKIAECLPMLAVPNKDVFEQQVSSSMYANFIAHVQNSNKSNISDVLQNEQTMELIKTVLKLECNQNQLYVLHLFSMSHSISLINFDMFTDNHIVWVGGKISKKTNVLIGVDCILGTVNITFDDDVSSNVSQRVETMMNDVLNFVTDLTDLASQTQQNRFDNMHITENTRGESK